MEELRRDRRIVPFILKGEITGRHMGNGPYGSVEEVSLVTWAVWWPRPAEGGGGAASYLSSKKNAVYPIECIILPIQHTFSVYTSRLCS